jgi:hypothetical protein
VVTFSEAMSTTSLSVMVQPDPGGWSATWAQSDTVVLLTHAPFAYDTTYTVTVQAQNLEGEALVPGPVPNPWAFATESEAPFVVVTRPADGAVDVALDAAVVITFSQPIDTATFTLTAVPDPGGWSATWSQGDTVVTLAHAPFAANTTYSLTVWAEDMAGLALVPGPVPNPWAWTTRTQVQYAIYLPVIVK